MFGTLLLIAASFIAQGPQILPGSSNFNTPSPAERCKTGWGPDRATGKYVFTIQIDPSALATFAEGAFGKDMAAPIPEHIRPFVEEVIVRIGTADLARIDPTPEMQEAIRRNYQPSLTTLDGRRGLVDIDRSLAVSGTSNLNNSPQIMPPTNQPQDNNYANSLRNGSTDILPNETNRNLLSDANRNPATLPFVPGSNNSMNPPYRPAPLSDVPSLSTNSMATNAMPGTGLGAMVGAGLGADQRSSTPMRDEFRPANSVANSMLSKMTGNTQPSVGSYTAPYTQSYSRTAANPTGAPLTPNPINAQYNTNPASTWGNGGIGPQVPTGYDPNYYVANNTGRTLPQQTNLGGVQPGGTLSAGQAGGGLGVVQGAGQAGTLGTEHGYTSSTSSAVQWLPFVTIFLLVVNIYQFFWMAHVRTRYKELVISKRNAQLNLAG